MEASDSEIAHDSALRPDATGMPGYVELTGVPRLISFHKADREHPEPYLVPPNWEPTGPREHWQVEVPGGPYVPVAVPASRVSDEAAVQRQNWWTCKQCGERWNRSSLPTLDEHHMPKDNEKVMFGPHAGMTHSWLLEHRPQYCHWVVMAAELDPNVPLLLRALARYIQSAQKRQEQMLVEPMMDQAMQEGTIINSDCSISDPPFDSSEFQITDNPRSS